MNPAVECHHCGETAADAPLLCFCGVPVVCDACEGDGCKCCGLWGWFMAPDAPEAVEDSDELNGWDWENARCERAEAGEGR